ncbi:MAG TPA: penicillin acylase family protein, partial [Longimicrobiales bacterium]|nr:penicillin acylase family protein [Longimicrobiales bacterium]
MRLAHDVTISRDEWGVPHIHGRSDASVAFGVAYAMAEDNYWQIEEDFLEDLGRSAQWYGESRLAADLVRAAFRVESLAREEYAREPPERRRVWDAFALGLNHYLATHPGTLRRIIGRYDPWMVFARYRDAHAGDVIDGLRLDMIASPDGHPEPPGPAAVAPDTGSAAWAVAPARTAAGRALLIASRTAPFFGRGQLYEVHLHSDEGWHVSGVARLGTPVPSAGHNEQLAWTHTRGLTDRADVFRVVFDHPEDSLAYRHGDEWRRAITWTDTLLVNTPAGVQAQEHGFLRTHHGPLITRRGDTAYVAAIAGLEEGGALAQWYALGRATSIDAFRNALASGAASAVATMYADVAGNIMYVEAAAPGRAEGPSRTRPVSGNDPAFEWQAAAPLDQR